jgi:hypothetical protein
MRYSSRKPITRVAGVNEILPSHSFPTPDVSAIAPRVRELLVQDSEQSAPATCDVPAVVRLRDYQNDIDRASALLCKVQPDLIAGEVIAMKESEPPRAGWPFVFSICVSGLFWLGIGWAVTRAI